ncbi:MAG TPA: hypothetical protein VKU19_09650 [Bryobacteraceae bacterium]|nr:hypothetical protein [Bryobacteraceae bacterium]
MSAIPWKDLNDAFGPATEVPGLVAEVARSRGEDLNEALSTLCGHVLHQGTIYSASPPVVQAIIAFARDADPPERSTFYQLLDEFAGSARKAIADGRAIPSHAGGDPVDGRAIRDAILGAEQQFLRDLGSPTAGIRAGAAALAAGFPEASPEAANLVRESYFVEPDIRVRREIIVAMIRVRDRYPDWPGLLEAALRHESDGGNRFFLLQAQVVNSGASTTDATVADLISTFASFYGTLDFYLGGEAFFNAIHRLGTERELAAMLRALDAVTGQGAAVTLAQRLLVLVFTDPRSGWGSTASSKKAGRRRIEYWGLKGKAPALPLRWNTAQRNVVEAIARKERLWQFDTNLWELFGLPNSSAAIMQVAALRTERL